MKDGKERRPMLSRRVKWMPVISLLIALFSLSWNILTSAKDWASADLRRIIRDEAVYAISHDFNKAASLYMTDSPNDKPVMYDKTNNVSYSGMLEIQGRYQSLPQFKGLLHVNVNITDIQLISGHALASSGTIAVFMQNNQPINILNVDGDRWEFVKVHQIPFLPWTGQWKIKSFSF